MRSRYHFSVSVNFSILLCFAIVVLQFGISNACDLCGGSAGHGHAHAPAPSMINGMSFSGVTTRAAGSPFRFAVVADTQGQENGSGSLLRDTVASINSFSAIQNVDYVLFPGDLIANTGNAGWGRWNARTSSLGLNSAGVDKRLMTPGNHDVGAGATEWQNNFSWLPDSQTLNGQTGIDQVDYFVDHGNIRFVSISTDAPGAIYNGRPGVSSGQAPPALNWMREVMKDVDVRNADSNTGNNIDHVFTFSHRPVTTQNESPTGGTNGSWWESMTGQAGSASGSKAATALLAGHWHMYQPSRPDADVDTAEIISGTGGGGLEGQAHRNRHGYSIITVDGGNVSSEFFAASSNGNDTWSFGSADTFTIAQTGGLATGELARYAFEGAGNSDSSTSALSKGHSLHFNNGASLVNDAQRGSVLSLSGSFDGGFVDAKNIGDNNLAILGDLKLSFSAKVDAVPNGDTFIATFGGAHGSANGSLNNQESANVAYTLAFDSSGQLFLDWQHDDATWEGRKLSGALGVDITQWHDYEVIRDAAKQEVRFYVDGVQVGSAISFSNFASGGGSGSLYLGSYIPGSSNFTKSTRFNGRIDNFTVSSSISAVPEPAGLIVLSIGSLLACLRRKRRG